MAQVHGTTTDRFAGVRDVSSGQLEAGADVGASIAVIHRGELVVDLWVATPRSSVRPSGASRL
jgi:hypothetical protein